MTLKWCKYGFVLLAGAAVPGYQAFAADSSKDDTLEEIIVTAQNRVENVQKVPIAINVVSAEQMAESGFSDITDIGKVAPAVQITNDNSQIHVTVRGVGTNSNDEAQDTSVVVNVDGEYINRPTVLGVSMFDMDRIEVLRGPQGTLYGRNSTGGAINFITRKPGEKFAVDASAGYGNYGAYKLEAGVDVPFGPVGAIRFSGVYSDRDGYFSHPASTLPFPPFSVISPAAKSASEKNSGGRVSLRLNPVDALSINLAAEYATRDYINQAYQTVDLNSGAGPAGPGCNADGFVQVAAGYVDTLCIPKNTNFLSSLSRSSFGQPIFGVGGYTIDSTALRGRVSYEFSPALTLTYVGGYRSSSGTGHQGLPVVYQSFTFQADTKTQSHELRLNGDIGKISYQAGLFYFKEKLDGESAFAIPVPVFGPDGSFLSYFGRYVDSDSKSAFAQVDIPVAEKLKLVAGLRYTDNQRTATYKNGSAFGATGPNFALFGQGVGRKDINAIGAAVLPLGSKDTKTTWLVGLNYTLDDTTLLYGKASTGFKGGGFDSVGTFKPETNTALEVGLKKNFGAGGRHYFNVSAFHYDYKDLQTSVLLDTSIGGQTFNAGKATIWGAEAETGLRLTEDDTISASLNYLNAKFDEFLAAPNVFCVGGCNADANLVDYDPNTPGVQHNIDYAGNTPSFSPKVIAALGYDHVFHLGSAGTLKASLSTIYKSSYYTDFFNYNDLQQEAYTQSDVSLEYRTQSKHLGVQAYVHNIEDKRPLTYAGYISAGPDDILNWGFGTPRLYGLRLSVTY